MTTKTPDKFVTLRVPAALHKALKEQAKKENRTMCMQVIFYINNGLNIKNDRNK